MSNLNPHLKSHIVELDSGFTLIHHPLVITPYNDNDFVINDINSMYQRKQEMLNQAKREHNFFKYVFLHERPYRVRIFHSEVLEWDISKQDFWWLFKDVWLDSENIFENKILWHSLLKTHRDEPQLMMNEDERETLESMPDKLTIYRGGIDDKGFSWTLNKDTAKWFAKRWDKHNYYPISVPSVFEKEINKVDVLAYLDDRNEEEILYIP